MAQPTTPPTPAQQQRRAFLLAPIVTHVVNGHSWSGTGINFMDSETHTRMRRRFSQPCETDNCAVPNPEDLS